MKRIRPNHKGEESEVVYDIDDVLVAHLEYVETKVLAGENDELDDAALKELQVQEAEYSRLISSERTEWEESPPKPRLHIMNLAQKLVNISKNLFLFPQSSLDLLHNAVDEVEMINLLNSISLEEYDTSPMTQAKLKIQNHGKIWKISEIIELDGMLKNSNITIEEIADYFARSRRSILLKAASIIVEKLKSGECLERSIMLYNGKIGHEDILRFQELQRKDFFNKLKKRKKS